MKDTKQKLSPVTIALHWIVGLSFILILCVGFYMANTKTYALYDIHKSFGVLLFFLIVIRVVWRTMNGWPIPLKEDNKIELMLAKIVHWLLLLGTLLMPISGMLMSASGGRGVYVFGLEIIASNPDMANSGKVIPLNESLASIASSMHTLGGWVIGIGILLHIAGAIKHHHVYKDGTLLRMKGKTVE